MDGGAAPSAATTAGAAAAAALSTAAAAAATTAFGCEHCRPLTADPLKQEDLRLLVRYAIIANVPTRKANAVRGGSGGRGSSQGAELSHTD